MTSWDRALLNDEQAEYVAGQLKTPLVIDDLSWNLVDTRVLHVRAEDQDFVVKAAPQSNHHIGREITAHETYTEPLVGAARTGQLVAASRAANVLITTYLPGTLVQGSDKEWIADMYTQAGSALRALHDQHPRVDDGYEIRMTDKAIALLDRQHRIASEVESAARRILASYQPAPVVVVPTHGDWQPRNWLHEGNWLQVIDFGRFDFRPAASDFCRLATQQWRERPRLENAFLEGYGSDPRNEEVWPIDLLREAVGTAVWAFLVGDTVFEAQGHRMLEEAIVRF
ncbi:phosphotransferase [Arthrobacter sp. Br18]|uniref:phosphotransferase n=1 Tax=Arthrobacter sp. Br18 TaxID=1312954 RepID=UPI00047ED03A|nr:phosphotransferase [Arthrobacter sp. Br18]